MGRIPEKVVIILATHYHSNLMLLRSSGRQRQHRIQSDEHQGVGLVSTSSNEVVSVRRHTARPFQNISFHWGGAVLSSRDWVRRVRTGQLLLRKALLPTNQMDQSQGRT